LGSNNETRTFDAEGNLLSRTDAAGQTIRYEYDKLNRFLVPFEAKVFSLKKTFASNSVWECLHRRSASSA
jgi:hypothetical protein